MMSSLVSASTRRLQPSHRPWTPHDYQIEAADFLCDSGAACLWLDPGLRKTSITLEAIRRLKAAGVVQRVLVIAPLKVCQLVWRQEAQKWSDFRDLTFQFLHGPKKAQRLREEADIYLINPEGVAWLAGLFKMRPQAWPFDTVVIDEITKFKNSQSDRNKALRPVLRYARRRWGLTGTPAPNGYMDLFGQWLMLDDGAALGRYITHYRDMYFVVDYNGFDYVLQPGAERRVQEKLAPYVYTLDDGDYVKLPELLDDPIYIELPAESRKAYQEMKNRLLAELPGGQVEAANTAAAYSKMKQMSGGAVYATLEGEGDELAVTRERTVIHLHDAKLEALDDLIESLDGQQLLIAYEFQHEVERLRARYPTMAFMADAKGERAAVQLQADWNSGKIRLLACHPASAGHGLNLQESHAAHLCWFAPIWDLELWDQFIRRLRRSGNEAAHIVRHVLIVKDTIDELALSALEEKDTTQARLRRSLRTLLHGAETRGVETPQPGDTTMVQKLSRGGAPAPAENTERPAPKGWGKPATAAPSDEQEQREAISAKLTGLDNTSQFSGSVAEMRQAIENGDDAAAVLGEGAKEAPATRTRRSKAETAAPPETAPGGWQPSPEEIAARAAEQRRYGLVALCDAAHKLVAFDMPEELFDPLSDKILELLKEI